MSAPTSPAGSRRFWLTVLVFAHVNIIAWFAYHHSQTHHPFSLCIESFAPGGGALIEPRATLAWRFNGDVVPAPGHDSASRCVAITPTVAGRWQWADRRTLSFTTGDDLPKATRFTLNITRERFRKATGCELAEPFQASVHSAPLQIVNIRQAAAENNDRFVIELEFNDKVLPADVLNHLRIQDPNRKPLGARLHGEAAGNIVRVVTDPIPAVRDRGKAGVVVALSAGLGGASGPLGLEKPVAVRLMLEYGCALTKIVPSNPGRGKVQLNLRFNNNVNLATLRPLISVEPPVPFVVTDHWSGVNLEGDFQPGTRYAVKIAKPPASADNETLPQPGTFSVFVPDRQPAVWFEHESGYLGSRGNRTVLVHAVNLPDMQLTVTRVYENNLVAWSCASDRRDRWDLTEPFSRPVASKKIKLSLAKNRIQDLHLALDELLPSDDSHDGIYSLHLEADTSADALGHDQDDDEDYRYHGPRHHSASAVITLSDIGLVVKQGQDGLHVWAVSLSSAKPLPGVRVRLFSNKNQSLGGALTNSDGLAHVSRDDPADGEFPAVVTACFETTTGANGQARRGLTWLDLGANHSRLADHDTAGQPYLRAGHEAFLYSDRGVYRPGEMVHLRAIVRGPDGVTPPPFPVRWQLRRPDLRDWRSEIATLDADGACGLSVKLPADLPTGRWSAHLGLPGEKGEQAAFFGTVTFQVEEFMPDRMKVTLELGEGKAARFQLDDKPLTGQVRADYLFGQPVADRPAAIVARLDPTSFQPKDWKGWTFGDAAQTATALGIAHAEGHRGELPAVQLDERGKAHIEIDLAALAEGKGDDDSPRRPTVAKHSAYPEPWRLTVTASVSEVGGRAVSATRELSVDRVPHYVGVRPQKSGAGKPGEPFTFDVALVRPDGQRAEADAEIETTLFRESWNNSLTFKDGRYHYVSTRLLEPADKNAATAIVAHRGRGMCQVTPPSNGSYVCLFRDTLTGCVASHAFHVSDGSFWEDNISREHPERLELVVLPAKDKRKTKTDSEPQFRIGDRAEVIVRSPFAGRLLLTVETDQVVTSRVVEMTKSQTSVPIQITEALRPNAYVCATVVRAIDPNVKWRTHRAFGVASLAVNNTDRQLRITVSAPKEMRPCGPLGVDLRITNENGKPVSGAGVTLAAVDEGICQLTGFDTPDPHAFFHAKRSLGVELDDLYSQLMPEVAKPVPSSAVGGDEGYDPRHRSAVAARRVKPVALVSGVLHSDADGKARAEFNVPEFTGQLRVMAVSYAGKTYGCGEQGVFVRSPLLVQSSWPRFAAPGDRFSVLLTIFNNTDIAGKVEVAVELLRGDAGAENPLAFADAQEKHLKLLPVSVAARGQATVSVDIAAAQAVGVARARVTAQLGGESFEENTELPVRPPSPMMTHGGYAVATPGAPAKIVVPAGMLSGTKRLEVRATPWPQLDLPEGLDYLDRYPYGCVEQITSGLFPLVYLHDIGERIAPGLFDKQRVADKVQFGLMRLIAMQTADGGLAMWPAYRETWPWASVYAAHFVVEAEAAGHKVPEDFRSHLLVYARGLLNRSGDETDLIEAQSYACYVLARAGRPERANMDHLSEVVKVLPARDGAAQARFWLGAAWLEAGRPDRATGLIPETIPQPRRDRQSGGNVGSPIRDRAVIIMVLLSAQPDHPALPALVQQLADAGRKHQWGSTQDTAFAVMALGRYLRQAKPAQPFETAELWLGNKRLAGSKNGRPLIWTPKAMPADGAILELRVTGPAGAKAHMGWSQTGVTFALPAVADNGLKVRRRYLDEHGKPLPTLSVRSGQLVQVELSIEGSAGLKNVVIEDLLPTGLEIENPRLQTTARKDAMERREKSEEPPFVDEREEVRDDRLVLLGRINAAGAGRFVYLARAVTPGTFIVPPVRAECMYDLGTSSLNGGGEMLKVASVESKPMAKR